MKLGQMMPFVLASALAVPAMAGEKGYKCTADAQACLTKMAAELKDRGWVGIEYDHNEDGKYTVKRVIEESPAEAAGLKQGDVLLALNGVELSEANKKKIKAQYKELTPGAQATYTVKRSGEKTKVTVTLGELPRSVLAQWVGMHMIDNHAEVKVAAN